MGFTWSVFGSSELWRRNVKPNPDRPKCRHVKQIRGRAG
nr:cation diffusion facilitator family transporter [Kroppenstedtia eburnea]